MLSIMMTFRLIRILTLDNYMHGPEQLDSVSVKTKIGWTTSSHCGGAVPVFAIGATIPAQITAKKEFAKIF